MRGSELNRTLAATIAAIMSATPAAAGAQMAPVDAARIVRTLPHDRAYYTEGLFLKDGVLYESTGVDGQSEIHATTLEGGRVLRRGIVPKGVFGEGAVDWGSEIVSVSWITGAGFRWDAATLRLKSRFTYPGEGWGLTRNARSLIMSDGTADLRLLDPRTFRETGRIHVTDGGRPVRNLNELEWIDGEIWANVWLTDMIARIDPATGVVKRWVDISSIAALEPRKDPNDVANGIAWDAVRKRIYVTGKRWGAIYQIKVGNVADRR